MENINVNVIIKGCNIYHPESAFNNSYFIEHFEKLGLECEGLMKKLGRKNHYLINNDHENALTMGIESSKKALESAGIAPEDLDMIVFVSETPEYTCPTTAMVLRERIGAKNANVVYDMNCNCLGMLMGADTVSRFMKTNKRVKHALIVGSIYLSFITKKTDNITYPLFGDGSGAVILEREESDEIRGFIDSIHYTDSSLNDKVRYPKCGHSKIHKADVSEEDKLFEFVPHDVDFFAKIWTGKVKQLLEETDISISEIDHFIFSQFDKEEIKETLENLDVEFSEDKYTFVCEKYGYTGNSSPFFALYEAMKTGKIKEGSKVIFCGEAIGFEIMTVLYQF
ncbi:ketoacyl-ACP synthase III [Clostridium ganghwense]|uniref:Ketoacyl-ACP synthase III n=1 Tax=Clostridium ganghwense TaxID=312089 RepID=A0ABT4CQY6_9CLOT|nr:ketoacyl-ACP synthase III [Clostridium ganghwense]MCY6371457.1 ketoacyl-ACP synthase III [Clostridium ganghwense]